MLTIVDRSHARLGDKGGNDLHLTQEESEACTELSLRRNYIKDSNVNMIIEPFLHLTWLCLSANALTEVPSHISSLVHLEKLFLCNNKITSISQLQNCSNLKVLSLRHNMLTELGGLGNLQSLECLTVSGNRISSIDLSQIPDLQNLRSLGLYGNKLSDLNLIEKLLHRCPNIRKLFIGCNPFTGGIPLKEFFHPKIIYTANCDGVKRQKCEESLLTLSEMYKVVLELCPVLQIVDNVSLNTTTMHD